ncbi:hypothetical protein T484DRAFT_1897644 [Baffinella frigidus]|nr:hypothetical protein T484DRAFT_1897644 [Cryptophyta sp. CCMP2293]
MGRYRGLYVALLLLALPLQAPGASRNAVADAGMGSEARRTPVFVTFWDIMPDGRTLASRTQDTPDTPTPTPNISQWVEAIIHAPSDAGLALCSSAATQRLGLRALLVAARLASHPDRCTGGRCHRGWSGESREGAAVAQLEAAMALWALARHAAPPRSR